MVFIILVALCVPCSSGDEPLSTMGQTHQKDLSMALTLMFKIAIFVMALIALLSSGFGGFISVIITGAVLSLFVYD